MADVWEGIAGAFLIQYTFPRGGRERIAEAGLTGGMNWIEGVIKIKEAVWTVDAGSSDREILKCEAAKTGEMEWTVEVASSEGLVLFE